MNYENERLVRAIIRKFENTGIAEDDLFQEGMLALLKAERTYHKQGGAKFETYASVVIRNHLIDVIRTHKTEPTVQFEIAATTEEITDAQRDEKKAELLKILHETLHDCSAVEKAIFNAYFQGYSYQEICAIFGINQKKVDNTIQKIRKLAKANYND